MMGVNKDGDGAHEWGSLTSIVLSKSRHGDHK
jgi:hypothetical protein